MFLRFKDGMIGNRDGRIRTVRLSSVIGVIKVKWNQGWSIEIDMSRGNYTIVSGLTEEEADEIEYKIIQGMMSKEDGVLEIV